MKRRKLLKKTKTQKKLTIKKMVVLVIKFLANSFIFWGLHFERFLFDKMVVLLHLPIFAGQLAPPTQDIFIFRIKFWILTFKQTFLCFFNKAHITVSLLCNLLKNMLKWAKTLKTAKEKSNLFLCKHFYLDWYTVFP